MTKADLIEEVSRGVELTRKDAEVIVEAIFDSIVRSLRGDDKIEIRGSAASGRDRGRREWAAIRKPVHEWKFPPEKFLISNPVKS
jgi:hypothetical protein